MTITELTSQPEDLVTATEASVMADRSKSSVRAWVRDGKLTGYRADISKPNSALMVSKSELLRFLSVNLTTDRPKLTGRPQNKTVSQPKLKEEKELLQKELEMAKKEIAMLVSLTVSKEELSDTLKRTIQSQEATIDNLRTELKSVRQELDRQGYQLQQTLFYLTLPWWKKWNASIPLLEG